MKIVINACFGGFSLPTEFCEKYNVTEYDDDIERTDERLVSMIESGNFTQPRFSKLVVKKIPENSTDYIINEYDGAESIYYVVDGKIHMI